MDSISLELIQLQDPNNLVRLEACEQLALERDLPEHAIVALKKASNDSDPHVAEAALRALRIHEHYDMRSPTNGVLPPDASQSDYPWSWIGNLHIAHLLFLIVGTFMLIMATLSEEWAASLFILGFIVGSIIIFGMDEQKRHKTLIEIWSELARQTGLQICPGQLYFFGTSIPPSVSGIYHGRRVSVTKVVEYEGDAEASIPAVDTRMSLEVKNAGGYHFSVGLKPFLSRLFRSRSATCGDSNFDKHFQFEGKPEQFFQKACRLIVDHPMLLDRPDGVIMLTDQPLSAISWSRPSIKLQGSQLICVQSGVPTEIPGQVEILDLLCELAELAEEEGRQEYDGLARKNFRRLGMQWSMELARFTLVPSIRIIYGQLSELTRLKAGRGAG